MTLTDEFDWICIEMLSDRAKAYELEQIFYTNKLPIQVREKESEFALWVPMKYKTLSIEVVENYLKDNLSHGFVKFEEDKDPSDNIRIGRQYERHVPSRFYFFLLLIAIFLVFLRFVYGIDFL